MSTCPDSNLYSALADGEVPSPWREKLEAHIASCPACQKRVARYRKLRSLLRDGAPNLSENQLEASYLKLVAKRDAAREEARIHAEADAVGASRKPLKFPGWAHASISLPLPALAALI
ncbi:MAG TPA: zf-HC2 domain-containing protein, partial [Treponemataceae bacterium]|nr:zf-HC2 domain-containing protein [Treponemataceae bacterium]